MPGLRTEARRPAQDAELAEFGEDYRDHGSVFCSVDGEPPRPDILTREFLKHAAAYGFTPIRLHDLRHGACSLMLSDGVPIEIVQLILGHSGGAQLRDQRLHLDACRSFSRLGNGAVVG